MCELQEARPGLASTAWFEPELYIKKVCSGLDTAINEINKNVLVPDPYLHDE